MAFHSSPALLGPTHSLDQPFEIKIRLSIRSIGDQLRIGVRPNPSDSTPKVFSDTIVEIQLRRGYLRAAVFVERIQSQSQHVKSRRRVLGEDADQHFHSGRNFVAGRWIVVYRVDGAVSRAFGVVFIVIGVYL